MLIKCGREECELNSKDIIIYNGSCYMIVTKNTNKGHWPAISKATAQKLIKEGKLIFIERKKIYIEVDIYMIKESE